MDPTKNLILMVKDRPAIWDKTCEDYRDKAAKDRAWVEIYRQMEPSYDSLQHMMKNQIGSQITKKWYNVRDSYRKSLKSNFTLKRARPYIYSDQLTFLDNVFLKTITDTDEEREDLHEQSLAIDQVFIDTDEETAHQEKRFKTEETSSKEGIEKPNEENIISVLTNIIQKEEDEDRSFFKSITPSVKSLSEEAKLEFRIQVMKLIRKLKTQDRVGVKMKNYTSLNEDSD